jgi:hypothetical protein
MAFCGFNGLARLSKGAGLRAVKDFLQVLQSFILARRSGFCFVDDPENESSTDL